MDDATSIEALKDRLVAAEMALRDQRADLERLRETEIRHTLLIGSWAQALWETDATGVVVADSPSWRAFTGQTLDEWLGYGWLNAVHPDDRAYAERQWHEAMAARSLVNAEFRLCSPDGGWRWTNVRAAPVLDADGRIEKWAGMNIDIDARKRAEEALRESEELRRIAITGGRMGTWRWNLRDERIWGDALFMGLWGFPPSDEPRRLPDFTARMSEQGEAEMGEMVSRAAAAGEEFDGQLAVVDGPTKGRWIRWRGRAERERPWIIYGVTFDVTEQRLAEERLRASEERQAFLLKFSDTLRAQPSADAIACRAIAMLLEHLRIDRCYITYYRPDDGEADFPYQVGNETVSPLPAKVRLSDFPDAFERVREKTFVIEDDFERRGLSEAERSNSRALGMRAMVASTVRIGERNPLSSLVAVSSRPRQWTHAEIAVVEEAAERTWAAIERARSEAALAASEEKYRAVFDTIAEGFITAEVIYDDAGRAVDALYFEGNPAASRLTLGRSYDHTLLSELVPDREDYWVETYDRVARTGTPERLEKFLAPLDRWYDYHVSRVSPAGADGTGPRVAVVFQDVTERRRAEKKLRESEERQIFLLRLSDAVRPLTDPVEVKTTAMKLLAEQLDVMRASYFEFEEDEDHFLVTERSERDAAPIPERMRMSDFSPAMANLFKSGGSLSIMDAAVPGEFVPDPAAYAAIGVRALAGVPLLRGGRLVACIGVHSRAPRPWSPADLGYLTEVAERTWSAVGQARAEEALRESEERLREFGEASQDVLWIRNAETLQWVYLTQAFEETYGLDRAAALAGDNMTGWLDLIVPEDRRTALDSIQRVRAGEQAAFEYRIRRPSDGQVRWVRDTDFPMRDANGQVRWLGGVGRDITEEKASIRRQEVLVNELQHRARNLLGVVTAVAGKTLRQGSTVESFEDRLQALSRAQALLSQAGSDTVEVGALVRAELAAYTQDGSEQLRIDGPEVQLTARQVQNFALALHELTTNAVKYGALKDGTGSLAVTWEVLLDRRDPRRLALRWVESGVPVKLESAPRRGYGTELIQDILGYALEADVAYELSADGVRCRVEMPVS